MIGIMTKNLLNGMAIVSLLNDYIDYLSRSLPDHVLIRDGQVIKCQSFVANIQMINSQT